MIINKIRLQEENPMTDGVKIYPLAYCDLHLTSDAGQEGYLLKDSIGLEPPDINEIVEGFDIYGNPTLVDIPEMRELIFKIGLTPKSSQTFGQLRDHLYKFISRTILVSLMQDSKTIAVAVGHIRRFPADLFTNKPSVEITIECQHGLFYQPSANDIPAFELGNYVARINYADGTGPTGLDLQFVVTEGVSSFDFSNYGRGRSLSTSPASNLFRVTYPLIVGDVVTISTLPRERSIILDRSGVLTDLAGYLNAGAVWPMLQPGPNVFDWSFSDEWMTWVYARYVPRYWGV